MIWKANPGPQTEALRRTEFETLYGGARGGGKTDAGITWISRHYKNSLYRGLVIRKNADDLSDWVDRAGRRFQSMGASISYRPPVITFDSGAIIKTGHLKDDQAYTKYQGHEYQRMLIEELNQIPTEKRYLELLASCRSTVPGISPRFFGTTNPGGVGHAWVKKRFIDVAPAGVPYKDQTTNRHRVFIPANIDDNPVLMKADPDYVNFLEGLKNTDVQLWKAWRHGDWDVFIGQAFSEFTVRTHVSDHFPWSLSSCFRIGSFDWGYNAPGCFVWTAYSPEDRYGTRRAWTYREIYQNKKTPEQWANDINMFVKVEGLDYIVLPHDCFARKEGGDTIAEIFKRVLDVPIFEGHTLERESRLNRKALTHQWLSYPQWNGPLEKLPLSFSTPLWTIHPRCYNLIRTLPELVYSDTNPEDIDTDGDDHAWDAQSLNFLSYARRGKGQAIKQRQPQPKVPTAWANGPQGEIIPDDLVGAMKDAFKNPRLRKFENG